MGFDSETPISRRTVAKGIAWSVPAVMVAGATPAYAASPILPPVFSWTLGCATTGSGGGCADGKKTPQVPVSISNPAGGPTLQLQILGTKSWDGGESTEPDDFTPATAKTIYLDSGVQSPCTPAGVVGCDGYYGVSVAPGTKRKLWIVGTNLGSADDFKMSIQWRLVETPCATPTVVVLEDIETAPDIISSNNCA